jgi:hypothetical protein
MLQFRLFHYRYTLSHFITVSVIYSFNHSITVSVILFQLQLFCYNFSHSITATISVISRARRGGAQWVVVTHDLIGGVVVSMTIGGGWGVGGWVRREGLI